jgi:threonine/homoserine/homoserine lactone efflux protein
VLRLRIEADEAAEAAGAADLPVAPRAVDVPAEALVRALGLELLLVVLLAAGLSAFLTQSSVSRAIAVCGGSFLLYMGSTMAKDAIGRKVSLSLSTADSAPAGHLPTKGIGPVWAGILISLANPYWTLWWATVGLGYVTVALESGLVGLAVFYTGHILADAIWYTAVAGAVAGGRRFLNDRVYRGILVVCGLFLIGLGCCFIFGAFI